MELFYQYSIDIRFQSDIAHNQKETLTAGTDSEFQASTLPKPIKMVEISKFRNTDISNIENHKDHTLVDEYLNENVSITTPVDFNESTTEYIDVSSDSSSSLNDHSKQQTLNNISTEETNVNKRSEFRLSDHPGDQTVQVRMQNTSVTESGATKLIYSVHLGGKPVPAETAARDMALLSPQEVALELGAPVIIQSERKCL